MGGRGKDDGVGSGTSSGGSGSAAASGTASEAPSQASSEAPSQASSQAPHALVPTKPMDGDMAGVGGVAGGAGGGGGSGAGAAAGTTGVAGLGGASESSASTQLQLEEVEAEGMGKGLGEARGLGGRRSLWDLFPKERAEKRELMGPTMKERKTAEAGKAVGQGRQKKLGLMIGVYLPSIQNVFGVVMFLRLSWMVGMMGTGWAFLMVFLCCLCTFLTTLSVSAIATNGVVESGGTYFMISRSLGPQVGMACGALFYLANAVAVAMYIVGAVEIFLNYICPHCFLWGAGAGTAEELYALRTGMADLSSIYNNHVRLYGLILLLVLFGIIALGVRVVQLFAPFSLMGVIVSIVAVYAGLVQKSVVGEEALPKVCLALPDHQLLYSSHCLSGLNHSLTDMSSCCSCHMCPVRAKDPHLCGQLRGERLDTGVCSANTTLCIPAIRGPNPGIMKANWASKYIQLEGSGDGEAGGAEVGYWQRRAADSAHGSQKQGVTRAEAEAHGWVFNTESTSFFAIMGIYFPSVTGILTGSNMSGDLADPSRSIPLGTLAAQLTTSFVYLSFVLIFGFCVEPSVLLDKNGASMANRMVMGELAWPSHWIIVVGCLLSTFGAGLQSLCSAPRLLASMAQDEVLPGMGWLGRTNCWKEPFNSLVLTTAIAFACLMLAKLDVVAPFTAMFFLNLYAWVNLACAVSTLMGAPGWRPRYKGYHWSLSLLGFFLAYFIMFSTFWYFALTTLVLGSLVVLVVALKGRQMEWGDGLKGLTLSLAQFFLSRLPPNAPHPNNWRPQLLLFVTEGAGTEELGRELAVVRQLKAGKGLVLVLGLLEGDLEVERPRADAMETAMREELQRADVPGFARAILYGKGRLGSTVSTLLQSAGLSQLRPNTIFSVWPGDWREQAAQFWSFMDRLHRTSRQNLSLLIVKELEKWPLTEGVGGEMHLWWILSDGGLLLLLAHLLRKSPVWAKTSLHIFVVVEEEEPEAVEAELENFLYKLRIPASIQVLRLSPAQLAKEDWRSERERKATRAPGSDKAPKRDPQCQLESLRLGAEWQGPPADQAPSYLEPEGPGTEATQPSRGSAEERPLGKAKADKAQTKASGEGSGEGLAGLWAAAALNDHMRERSSAAQLVLLNLPRPPSSPHAMRRYMAQMELLLKDLPPALLTRGTGQEVVSIYQ